MMHFASVEILMLMLFSLKWQFDAGAGADIYIFHHLAWPGLDTDMGANLCCLCSPPVLS